MKNGIRKYTCIGCGVNVEKSCTKKIKFCSPECYQKNKGRLGLIPKRGERVKCLVCGKVVYKPQSQIKENNFCSPNCYNEYQSNKVEITCIHCGDNKELSPSFSDQKYCSIKCRNESGDFNEHLHNINVIQQNGKETSIEKIGYKILKEAGINFVKQKSMFKKFCVDAYLPDINTVVQFDGDYWHGNPDKFKDLDKRQRKRVALDNSQDAYMKKAGVNVVRVWGSELRDSPKVLLDRLTML